jgi:hypothetical protein
MIVRILGFISLICTALSLGLFRAMWIAGEWTIEDAFALDTIGARFMVTLGSLLVVLLVVAMVQICTSFRKVA